MPVPTGPEPTRTGTFPGAGGPAIHWRVWDAPGSRADVVLLHGAGEHCGRYPHVAGAANAAGLSVWALDHRGHGLSEGRRAMIDDLVRAIADVRTVVGMATEQRGRPPLMLGHSMGGLIATAYTLRHQDTITALALSAPLVALAAASRSQLAISSLLSRLTPGLGVLAVDPAGVSRDPDVVQDYATDPLVHHGKLPVRTVAVLAAEIGTVPERAPGIALPLLVMYGDADRLVPTSGSVMLHDRASSRDKRLIPYPGLYHEILNEPERDEVIGELVGWLGARA